MIFKKSYYFECVSDFSIFVVISKKVFTSGRMVAYAKCYVHSSVGSLQLTEHTLTTIVLSRLLYFWHHKVHSIIRCSINKRVLMLLFPYIRCTKQNKNLLCILLKRNNQTNEQTSLLHNTMVCLKNNYCNSEYTNSNLENQTHVGFVVKLYLNNYYWYINK